MDRRDISKPSLNFEAAMKALDQYRKDFLEFPRRPLDNFRNKIKARISLIIDCYKQLSESERGVFIDTAIGRADALLLQALSTKERFINELEALEEKKAHYGGFLLSLDEEERWFITSLYHESSVLGKITYEGGLLTCAQIAARKHTTGASYQFNPVLLKGFMEFSKYLEILKTASPPQREIFIIVGEHWSAGVINIKSDGEVSILFMESLQSTHMSILLCMEECREAFENSKIYVPDITRQADKVSCMVYALDDARHLSTVEEHLPSEFKESGLHGYLAASARELAEQNVRAPENSPITPCKLPLSLMRTTQSRDLYKLVIPNRSVEEKLVPVKKTRDPEHPEYMTPEYAQAQFFDETKVGYDRYTRIPYILSKIIKFNLEFITQAENVQDIRNSKAKFTFEGFVQRKQKEKAELEKKAVTFNVKKS